MNELRKMYIDYGLCPDCSGRNIAMFGRRCCKACAIRAAERQYRYRNRIREAGLCTRCGGPRTDGEHLLCAKCRESRRKDGNHEK